MEMLDIINRAIKKSGVVGTFNDDEIPEDIQQRASDLLRHEIIPDINCDRVLDITKAVVSFTPVKGHVDLVAPGMGYDHYIFAPCRYSESELYHVAVHSAGGYLLDTFFALLLELGVIKGHPLHFDYTEKWPTDQLGNRRPIAVWSSDFKLLEIDRAGDLFNGTGDFDLTNKFYSIPWNVPYVFEVYRKCDGAEFKYLDEGELISAQYRHNPLVYTFEDNITYRRVRFSECFGNEPVQLVLPVPVTIVNSYCEPEPWEGTIVAPEKFRPFLLAVLAWRVAAENGVETKDELKEEAGKYYNSLVKNTTTKAHPQNIEKRIANYLRREPVQRGGYNG